MSSIDKMMIMGIRSFSPNNSATIAFFRPLTLIVGHNGAGKTTIIECLKVSCTGELPPNIKHGQYFIHDPKVAGETDVKAQIKLRFYDSQGNPFIIVRSFQLTQNRKSMQFKALDSTLSTFEPQTGQMAAMPHRCADINTLVPRVLGVSKAVLENVIFVHQEESNWPLGDAKTLKKTFDEIFAATKYTKALDELRKIRTKKMQEVREMTLRLEHLKTLKDHAAGLRRSAADNSRRAEKLREEMEEIERKMVEVITQRKEVEAQLETLSDLRKELSQIYAKKNVLSTKNAETFARLSTVYEAEDLKADVSELENLEKSLEPSIAKFEQEITSLLEKERVEEVKMKEIKAAKEKETAARAKLLAEVDVHHRNRSQRDAFLRQLACDFEIEVYAEGDMSEEKDELSIDMVNHIRQAFAERMEDAEMTLVTAKAEHRERNLKIEAQLNTMGNQVKEATEGYKLKEETVNENIKRIQNLQSELEDLPSTMPKSLVHLEAKVETTEVNLREKELELESSSHEQDNQRLASELNELSIRIDDLRSERATLASAADEVTRLEIKTQELKFVEKKFGDMMDNFRAELAVLLEVPTSQVPNTEENLKKRIESVIEERRAEVEGRSQSLREIQTLAATYEAKERCIKEQLNVAQEEMNDLASRLSSQVTSGKSIAQEIESAEKQMRQSANKVQHGESVAILLESQIKYAMDTCSCSTCARGFANIGERDAVVSRLKEQQFGLPSTTEEHQVALKHVEDRLRHLHELQPLAIRHEFLRDKEIPSLNRQLKTIELDSIKHEQQVEEASKRHEEAVRSLEKARSAMQEIVLPLESLSQEVLQREREVDGLRCLLPESYNNRTVTDVDAELASLENDRIRLQDEKESAMSALVQLRDAISSLRSEVYNAQQELHQLRSLKEKHEMAERQIHALRQENDLLVDEIAYSKHNAQPLQSELCALESKRHQMLEEAREEELHLEQSLRMLQTKETQLTTLENNLKDFEEKGKFRELENSKSVIADLQKSERDTEAHLASISNELGRQQKSIEECRSMSHQLAEIKAYRRSLVEESALAAEAENKEAMLGDLEDYARLEKRCEELKEQERLLQSESDKKSGSLATYRQMAIKDTNELNSKEYQGIESKYASQVIEKFTTELAASDLDKFHKALERALLSYHTSKMADINKIVKELWQKTYRGTDIDYIQIRADTEGGAAARSYNYRVVMICRGAELDMRGRCSAGQRVLACLVIRLALAETFCLNCGILALDEPTTNLDQDNADALAESLKSIMLARREQENFQLVVITHDERFAAAIGTREHAEYMWRVTKDSQQHSTLTREEIFG